MDDEEVGISLSESDVEDDIDAELDALERSEEENHADFINDDTEDSDYEPDEDDYDEESSDEDAFVVAKKQKIGEAACLRTIIQEFQQEREAQRKLASEMLEELRQAREEIKRLSPKPNASS